MLKIILIKANFIYAYFLLLIWGLPHTIAFRNLILAISALTFAYAICKFPKYFRIQYGWKSIPVLLICSLYLWVILHYFYFSYDKFLEFQEIKSIWLRALCGSFIAYTLGICFNDAEPKVKTFKVIFLVFILSLPIENIGTYIYGSLTKSQLLTPQFYVGNYPFKKIETAFFGSVGTAIFCSQIFYHFQYNNFKKIYYFVAGIILILLSGIVSNSKNAVVLSVVMILITVLSIAIRGLKNKSFDKKLLFLLIVGLLLVTTAIGAHLKYASPGWISIVEDVVAAIDIDKHTEWRDSEGAQVLPKNKNGEYVSGSTYLRVAWAVVGLRLINDHPAGYGSINRSFDLLLEKQGIPHWSKGQTHSGWVDFGLAYGKLGLLIMFATTLSLIVIGFYYGSSISYMAAYIGIIFLIMPIICETTWKQYFEATLFFLTLAASLVVRNHNEDKLFDDKKN